MNSASAPGDEALGGLPRRAIVAAEDGAPLAADFPIVTTVAGIEAVIIPLDRYKALLGQAGRVFEPPLKALRALRRPPFKPLPSTIERDPEVAAFLRERFRAADTIRTAHAACAERFGIERTPSRSRINTFRTKVRQGG